MPQCWAYSTDMVRCEQDGGHDGQHTSTTRWDDADCYQATPQTPAPAPPVTGISLPPLPEPMPDTGKCVGCGHSHRSGACKCGCYEYIG